LAKPVAYLPLAQFALGLGILCSPLPTKFRWGACGFCIVLRFSTNGSSAGIGKATESYLE